MPSKRRGLDYGSKTRNYLEPEVLSALHEAAEGQKPRLFRAPGRVNLVGEHTDYSGGFCMPAAINFETKIAATPRSDGKLKLHSVEFKETVEVDLAFEIAPLATDRKRHWSGYPLGVAWSLRKAGVEVLPASLTITGDVPQSAGLSSSASLEVATATALLALAGKTLPGPDVATLSQRAENDYVGSPCGIMDQFISANGKVGNAIKLDTRFLTYELAPIPFHLRLVITNSMVKHSVTHGSPYAVRRSEVEEGTAALHAYKPEIEMLRDATLADLVACADKMSNAAFKRCRHVITDSQRVVDGLALLRAGEIVAFGKLLNDAHRSFRDDFEASCPKCDTLAAIAQVQPGCYGARLTGGGFGGCVVSLVEADATEAFVAAIRAEYVAPTGKPPEVYVCSTADGACEITEGMQ